MSGFRAGSVLLIGSLLGTLLVSAPAAALQRAPVHSLDFTVAVSGAPKPYALNLQARDYGGGMATLKVTLSRRATTGSHPLQQHQWFIQNVTFTCAQQLASCNLDTSSANAASAGLVHLSFHPTGPATTTQDYCHSNHHLLGSHSTRSGKLTGTFRLDTHTTFFGRIRNNPAQTVHIRSSIRAKATKWTSNGHNCPIGTSCVAYVNLQANGTDGSYTNVTWIPSTHKGSLFWNMSSVKVGDVSVEQRIFGKTSVHFLKVTSNTPYQLETMSLDLSPFAPFVTGSGSFSAGAQGVDRSVPPCAVYERYGTFTGSWTAKLDGWGTRIFNGTDPNTYVSRYHAGP